MGSVGDCLDNAAMEAFWSRMQVELLDRKRWSTRVELANAIFEYLEIFHNRRRRHSSLGMLTPIEFEIEEDQHHESGRLKSRNGTPPKPGHSAASNEPRVDQDPSALLRRRRLY